MNSRGIVAGLSLGLLSLARIAVGAESGTTYDQRLRVSPTPSTTNDSIYKDLTPIGYRPDPRWGRCPVCREYRLPVGTEKGKCAWATGSRLASEQQRPKGMGEGTVEHYQYLKCYSVTAVLLCPRFHRSTEYIEIGKKENPYDEN